MKNDFREFYDEDYILHSTMNGMSEDDYIEHGRLLSTVHKFIDKFKNKKGKWVYVYPDNNGSLQWGKEYNRQKAYEDAYGRANRDYQYRKENQKSGQGLYKAQLAKDKKKNDYTYGYEQLQRDTRAKHQGNANALAQQNKNNTGYTYGYEQLQRDTRAKYQKKANDRRAASIPARSNSDRHDAYGHFYDDKSSPYGGYKLKQTDYAKAMDAKYKKKIAKRSATDSAYVSGRNKIGAKQSDYARAMDAYQKSKKGRLKRIKSEYKARYSKK